MCKLSIPFYGNFKHSFIRAALLFRATVPNLKLFLEMPWLQYKYLVVKTLLWNFQVFFKLFRKISTGFHVFIYVELM